MPFLADAYTVDFAARTVVSLACNIPAKEFAAILILHYAIAKKRGLPALRNEWQDFREVAGVEGYAAAFRARCIEPLIRKYGGNPDGLRQAAVRFKGTPAQQGDVGVVIPACAGIPVVLTLWKGDEEFGPDANVLFDHSITQILCTEDIIVLAEMLVRQL